MSASHFIGPGSINQLHTLISQYSPENILLVTGKKSFIDSGAESAILPQIKDSGHVKFCDFEENPKLQDVEKGLDFARNHPFDLVLAVGGGSPLDMAKLINILTFQSTDPLSVILQEEPINSTGKPLIAIPTTFGTGSEATHFAVVYQDKVKYSLAHPFMLPTSSIVDAELTYSLPPYPAACSGMDALCQAIESYWNIHSTEESRDYSRKAILIIDQHLEKAINDSSVDSRMAMAEAANWAGKAINITKTTAPHAISYPFTSYFGVNHGHAVGLTLPDILDCNYQVNADDLVDKRGVDFVKKGIIEICHAFGCPDVKSIKDKFKSLMNRIGLATKLSDIGIKNHRDIELIVSNINPERMGNNPRRLSKELILEVLISNF